VHSLSSDPARPPVTVVVPTRDRPQQLATCLRSLREALRESDELIVVDSASREPGPVAAAVVAAGGRLVRCELPGVNRARNAGWRAGQHDVVLFTDDDVEVEPGWADALAAAVQAHPQAGFVTGRILPPPGSTPSRDVAIKREEGPELYDAWSVGNLGHSASLGIRREVLEQLGGWDEALGVGGWFRSAPEADLFDRVFALDLSGCYEPAALAWHDQWRGPRQLVLLEARYGFGNGARLAKLARTDRRRLARAGFDAVGSWGLAAIVSELRRRHFYPALGAVVRLLATVAGFARAIVVPVVDGHFVATGSREARE
jgi:glycosyltransferase involved in cell wall biosynthesis